MRFVTLVILYMKCNGTTHWLGLQRTSRHNFCCCKQ